MYNALLQQSFKQESSVVIYHYHRVGQSHPSTPQHLS